MIATSSFSAERPGSASLPLVAHDASDRPSSTAQTAVSEPKDLPVTYSTDALLREPLEENELRQVNGGRRAEQELPRLQANAQIENGDSLEPILEDDPASFNLISPAPPDQGDIFSLETQTQALFSRGHLQVIFADPSYLFKFTSFLGMYRPQSVPILVHYLDSLKSLRAINYANAICEGLDPVEGYDFTQRPVKPTINTALEERAHKAFEILAMEELPAFITHQYIQVVSNSITARITGSLSPHLREASDGLAEVFCLTDPSRHDNPLVFASEAEFNRTTQYGMSYVLGRNCRFLQGPMTNPHSLRRIREALKAGRQHQEVLLNYRRDGSPFVNLFMMAPLSDSRGVIRYHIGAQVDVSGLVKDCSEMESLRKLLDLRARGEDPPLPEKPNPEKNDELRELSEMLNQGELNTIKRHGGKMHREIVEEDIESVSSHHQPRLLLKDPDTMVPSIASINGRLSGIYQHYLLVRPYPSLRILFASPSQRLPGILQSPFLNKIGGSNRVREELTTAFAEGRGVTAKVRWVTKGDDQGKNKWIHCTPLLGQSGQIGVWMVVVVDDEKNNERWPSAAGRLPPQVATPERSWTPAPSSAYQVVGSSQNAVGDMNGGHLDWNGGGSLASASGSATSLRIG
ncbi:uncharacterized protein A1O5_02430 [Cladophialophora psammophila CBS 110553]|uniref:PAS domain-containing protein n=1 Tax=Cladophialophora psammophila CBS 110553 TaxID=1182543 RepID=W9XB36_9EURO|nr:uncharacterized protein A1O5_02430 [Cladophialophora psammophila CBS 110553]EXJ74136.1 hypothetical protein A1O5_02430 [Cladophialophora psammophila CBS 110553]